MKYFRHEIFAIYGISRYGHYCIYIYVTKLCVLSLQHNAGKNVSQLACAINAIYYTTAICHLNTAPMHTIHIVCVHVLI